MWALYILGVKMLNILCWHFANIF